MTGKGILEQLRDATRAANAALNKYLNINERCRRMDLEMLWPECCRLAPDLDHAKAAFAVHALHDDAWLVLGEDAVQRYIDTMQPPPGVIVGEQHATMGSANER